MSIMHIYMSIMHMARTQIPFENEIDNHVNIYLVPDHVSVANQNAQNEVTIISTYVHQDAVCMCDTSSKIDLG